MNPGLHRKADSIDEALGFHYRFSYNAAEPRTLHYHEDYCEFFLTISGETIHIVNGKTFRLPDGCLVFVRPDDVHGYRSIGRKEYSFLNLAFYEDTRKELFSYISDCVDVEKLLSCQYPPTVQLNKTEKEFLLTQFNKLNLTNINDIAQRKMHFKRIIFDIFTRFFSESFHEHSTVPTWLENAVAEMKKQNNFVDGIERFRELCNKSNEHICRCVKEHYNQSPTELINDFRLNYAANLLTTTNKPITDICYECGFDNISWFYSTFKNKYSITPKSFRNRYATK